ncbi:hypothetical protein BJX63DRAFT_432529 [Aspergillus granulosus]|uniref:Fibronectin type-III domain-containing protein n=1 Tax=Aspergillus granulosus TaxID=176169 RepID=A0ABR4HCY2_9EURO
MHNEIIDMLNTQEVITVHRSNLTAYHVSHEKRAYQVFGLLGVQLLSLFGLRALEEVINALLDLFTSNDIVWTDKDNCCAYFSTQGGGNENFRSYARGHGNPTAEEWKNDYNGYTHHFVGPWTGTHGNSPISVSQPRAPLFPDEQAPDSVEIRGNYAGGVAECFHNTGHASFWGRQAAQTKNTIKDWVSHHKPDYLLILLGFNDLGWWVSGPETLVGDMGNIVGAAREAKPDIKLLVGNVVDRTFIKGRQQDLVDNTARYNTLLWDTIYNWFRCYEFPRTSILCLLALQNARGYEIRARVQGETGWWSSGDVYPNTHCSWLPWVVNGQTWEYQVRTKGDNDIRSEWSAFSSVTANVKTAPGPSNIIVEPQGNNVLVRWDSVTGTTWIGLNPGHRYGIWVATYVGMTGSLTRTGISAGGLPAPGREIIAGYGAPAPPGGLRVHNIDVTTIRLEWSAVAGASGYNVYARSIRDNTASRLDGTTTETSHGVVFLFPGIWKFEFCVSAFNGNLETAPVSCIIPPVCCGFEKRDLVPEDHSVAENTSTLYNLTSLIGDKGIRDLFAIYQQTAEYASLLMMTMLLGCQRESSITGLWVQILSRILACYG